MGLRLKLNHWNCLSTVINFIVVVVVVVAKSSSSHEVGVLAAVCVQSILSIRQRYGLGTEVISRAGS